MKFKAIGFDYGGVLHGETGAVFSQKFCELLGVTQAQYDTAYYAHNKKLKTGIVHSEKELWQLVLDDLGKSNEIDSVMNFVHDFRFNKIYNQPLLDLAHQLKKNGYKIGLLSNNTREMAAQMRNDGLEDLFDAFVVSIEIGFAKPEPRAFEVLAEKLEVQLSELAYIDDSEKSLSTASECGFTPLLFTTYEQLLSDLEELGIDFQ